MKTPIPIRLAVEDDLSEHLLRRTLGDRPIPYAVGGVFGGEGFGRLRRQAGAFNRSARISPFLLLTDLDRAACPPSLVREWLNAPKHPNFVFRVAVREVEAWVLADAESLSALLGCRASRVVQEPESLQDPKAEMLKLASGSPKRLIREAMVIKDQDSGHLRQGPDYNGILCRFVREGWRPEEARRKCDSFRRLVKSLERLEREFLDRGAGRQNAG